MYSACNAACENVSVKIGSLSSQAALLGCVKVVQQVKKKLWHLSIIQVDRFPQAQLISS